MITIDNKNYNKVVLCNRKMMKKQSNNLSQNGTVHLYTHGYHYEWDITIANLTREELNELEQVSLSSFQFVDDENYKCTGAIIGDIVPTRRNGFVKGNRYDVTFVISEV